MRALISVSDKTGVIAFAQKLVQLGYEILSTSGTMRVLREAGVPVTSVSEVTAFPEICNGRVKTLHPNIHGALLARRDVDDDMQTLKENHIEPIDIVCVNLYPFAQTVAQADVTMEDAVENIDIGGPSMLRSAAKNWKAVTVVVHPNDYDVVIREIAENKGVSDATRLSLSAKAFTHTAQYDAHIATYMRRQAGLPEKLFLELDERQVLRYGENPHQSARFFVEPDDAGYYSLATAQQLGGKELSYNNIQDANACLNIIREFEQPCAVGLKHMNPCGVGIASNIVEAWNKAFEADKVSIFGGIVAFNRKVTLPLAELLRPIFLEIVMAPDFDEEALAFLKTKKKNLRLLRIDMSKRQLSNQQFITVNGGMLVQDKDTETRLLTEDMCVTQRRPTKSQMEDLNFAWKIVKHVKSNAIVVVKDGMTLGVGAGQMNRIGSAHLAVEQAIATLSQREDFDAHHPLKGVVMASDGFFPFSDNVEYAHQHGIEAIVQPGGSIRDTDSIEKCDEYDMSMLFTGMRHFKH